MITSVKIQTSDGTLSGYLVNGNMSVPNDKGNRDYQEVQEWIAEGNTPEPEFTQAEIDANAQGQINQEALTYLTSTDWQLRRHSDEQLAGSAPSLSNEEITELLRLRQEARDSIK